MKTVPLSEFPSVHPPRDIAALATVLRLAGGIREPVRIGRENGGIAIREGFRRIAALQLLTRKGTLNPDYPVPVIEEIQFVVQFVNAAGRWVGPSYEGWTYMDRLSELATELREKQPAAVRMMIDLAL